MSVRRFFLGALVLVALVGVMVIIRTASKVSNALTDLDAMIVTPVSLTPQQTPAASDGLAVAMASAPTPASTATPAPLPDSPLTILLLGTDQRPKEEATRTDALVLVHLDRKQGKVSMLSLPRDLWVDIPGYGRNRINSAYPIGEKELGPGGGAALAKATVSRLLDIKVDHFMMVNFQGFREVIDLIGGIDVDVPHEIEDPDYPTEDYRTVRVYFRKGRQHLNGERALIYARTRHNDSDFGRNQRQQQILMAVFEQVQRQGLLAQLDNFDEYTHALRDYIRTDMSRRTMFDLARFGQQLNRSDLQRFAIDSTMIYNLKEPATFAADPDELSRLVRQMTGRPVAPAGVQDEDD